MRPSQAIQSQREAIRQIVASHHARNARIFGSALYGEDTEESDLDIVVDPTEEMTMFDIGAIRHELHALLGVRVDVVTPMALPERFRAFILSEAMPL